MLWTDRIIFLDKTRNQLFMTNIVGPHSDSELPSAPCEQLSANTDKRLGRLPLDRTSSSRPSVLDHGDNTMSNEFVWALGFDTSGVYDEEKEPAKDCCSHRKSRL